MLKKLMALLLVFGLMLVCLPALARADSEASAATLSAALSGSTQNGNTVTLGASVTASVSLTMSDGDTVILDLNGFKLTGDSESIALTVTGGRLVIRDSAGGGGITGGAGIAGIDSSNGVTDSTTGGEGGTAIAASHCVLVLESGTFIGGAGGNGGNGSKDNSLVIGGTPVGKDASTGGPGGTAVTLTNCSALISPAVTVTGGGGGYGGHGVKSRDLGDFAYNLIANNANGGNGGAAITASNSSITTIDTPRIRGGSGGRIGGFSGVDMLSPSYGNTTAAQGATIYNVSSSSTVRNCRFLPQHTSGISYSGWDNALSLDNTLSLLVTATPQPSSDELIVISGSNATDAYTFDPASGLFTMNITNDTTVYFGSNNAPVRKPGTAQSMTKEVTVGVPYTINLSNYFSDPNGDALTYKLNGTPLGGSSYTATADTAGQSTLLFTVADAYETSPDTLSVNIVAAYVKSIVSIQLAQRNGYIDTYRVSYNDNTYDSFTITNGRNGADGASGNGIVDLFINEQGHLISVLPDATEKDLGLVSTEQGAVLTNAEINEGRLILTMSDGSTIDAGQIAQPPKRDTLTLVLAAAALAGNIGWISMLISKKRKA